MNSGINECSKKKEPRPLDESDLLKPGKLPRVVEAAQQGSQERAPADLRGGQANIESKSAGVEKAGQPGNSGESGKAFVSEPLAAGRAEPFRACASVETFVFQPNN